MSYVIEILLYNRRTAKTGKELPPDNNAETVGSNPTWGTNSFVCCGLLQYTLLCVEKAW